MSNEIFEDRIRQAKRDLVDFKRDAESILRAELANRIATRQKIVDDAVRAAYDYGLSKAAIGRALGTKDYRTVQATLDRTVPTDPAHHDTPAQDTPTTPTQAGTWHREGNAVRLDNVILPSVPDGYTGTLTFDVEDETGNLAVPDEVAFEDFPLYAQVATVVNNGTL